MEEANDDSPLLQISICNILIILGRDYIFSENIDTGIGCWNQVIERMQRSFGDDSQEPPKMYRNLLNCINNYQLNNNPKVYEYETTLYKKTVQCFEQSNALLDVAQLGLSYVLYMQVLDVNEYYTYSRNALANYASVYGEFVKELTPILVQAIFIEFVVKTMVSKYDIDKKYHHSCFRWLAQACDQNKCNNEELIPIIKQTINYFGYQTGVDSNTTEMVIEEYTQKFIDRYEKVKKRMHWGEAIFF